MIICSHLVNVALVVSSIPDLLKFGEWLEMKEKDTYQSKSPDSAGRMLGLKSQNCLVLPKWP